MGESREIKRKENAVWNKCDPLKINCKMVDLNLSVKLVIIMETEMSQIKRLWLSDWIKSDEKKKTEDFTPSI